MDQDELEGSERHLGGDEDVSGFPDGPRGRDVATHVEKDRSCGFKTSETLEEERSHNRDHAAQIKF